MKTIEQQGMQAIQRSRELLVQDRTALSNHIRGLLMEFGIVIPQGFAALHRRIPEVLEDAENELPDLYRPTLNLLYGRLITIKKDIDVLNEQITALVKQNVACDRLTSLKVSARSARYCCMQHWVPVKRSRMAVSSQRIWVLHRSSTAAVARRC